MIRIPKLAAVAAVAAVVALACAHHYHISSTPPPTPPAPAPAPVVHADPDPQSLTEGAVTVAYARGMQIIVKRTPGAEFVAGQLYVRGGSRNLTAANAGIEDVAFAAATSGGTQTLDKTKLHQRLAALGASLFDIAGVDYTVIEAKAPRAAWDDLFPIFTDTFLAPALPASEIELARQRALAERRHEQESGDGRLWHLMRKTLFAGHVYGVRPAGTIETLTALKPGDVAPYLANLRDTNRLLLVVVGDVDPQHTIDQARAAFAAVPRGGFIDAPVAPLHYTGSHVVSDKFELPTNYIQTSFAGPEWNDPDFVPMMLGMSILNERVFDEVRIKRNLSYAPSAYFNSGIRAPFGALYVTAVDPNAAEQAMFDEVRRLQDDVIPAQRLDASKAVYRTYLTVGHETVDGQAGDLGVAQICGGDWRIADQNFERIRAVTPEAIHNAARRWLTNLQTVIVGDPAKLDAKLVGGE